MSYFLLALVTFSLGLLFVKIAQIVAIKFDIVDRPDSHIKTHAFVTPYLGGLGVISTFMVSFYIFNDQELSLKNFVELFSLFSIFLLGALDDKFSLSVKTRLLWQSIIVFFLLYFGNILHLTNIIYIDSLITFFGIITLINAMNILDILDGLMSGIAIIILITLAIINSHSIGNEYYTLLSIIYLVGLSSFLMFNFNPSSIFLGDGGSTMTGLFIAIIFINTVNFSSEVSVGAASLIAISLPLFELCYVSVLRLRKGVSPFIGSKDHFPLRKKIMGHTVKEVAITCYGLTFLTSIAAYLAIFQTFENLVILLIGIVIAYTIFGFNLSKIKIN